MGVEHWWNRQWGWARRDIWVHHDGAQWTVRAQQRQRLETEVVYADLDEAGARAMVDRLIRATPGSRDQWRRISG